MAESQTVTTLRAKRDAIASAIQGYERQLEQARADFAHVTAALTIFEAQDEPGTQRAYVTLYRYFKYGEIAALCRMALGEGSKPTIDLAKHVMAAKGLDTADRVLTQSIAYSVLRSMRGLLRRGEVRRAKHRNRCQWSLTSGGGAASSLSIDARPAIARLTSQSP
jgi:hypothetical protein